MPHFSNRRIISRMRTSAEIHIFLVLVFMFASGQSDSYPKPQVPSAAGQIAPDFTVKDSDGKDFKLSEQRGHWMLLFFYRGRKGLEGFD